MRCAKGLRETPAPLEVEDMLDFEAGGILRAFVGGEFESVDDCLGLEGPAGEEYSPEVRLRLAMGAMLVSSSSSNSS